MAAYKQLDYLKRCKIQALWKAGYSQKQIALEIDVHKSTISRELKRNTTFIRTRLGSWDYKADYAQSYADNRKTYKPKQVKLTEDVKDFVIKKLTEDWSPEQICGYAKYNGKFNLSPEWLYQFVLKDRERGGKLYLHLRHQNKKYRKRYGSPKRTGSIRNRRFIDERPKIVEERVRLGDWEIDTVIGKNHRHAIVSIVERKSKFTILKKVDRKTAQNVADVTIEALKNISDKVLSITADNGSEFAYHEKISAELSTEFFFAHPYASWERGLNENTNGLVRQYLKKGSCFSSVTEVTLANIMYKLNSRPRKTLNYLSPDEIFKIN